MLRELQSVHIATQQSTIFNVTLHCTIGYSSDGQVKVPAVFTALSLSAMLLADTARFNRGITMKVRMDQAPCLIESLLDTADECRADWERWMMRADTEANPDAKKAFENAAACEMNTYNAMTSDAEHLIQQITAAGDGWKRNP
jgi:hypothetical protein